MSNTLVKSIAAATALSIGALTLASPAEAGRRHHRHHGGGIAAAAILGLGAAAIIAGSQRRSYYNYGYTPYYYAPPRPYYSSYAPSYGYAPAPWTPAWYSYCAGKYRSFDPRSGTFQPFHGPRQLCR